MAGVVPVDSDVRRRQVPVVRNPSLTEDLSAEAVVQRRVRAALRIHEGVRARSQADDGLARLDVPGDARELIVGQRAEARVHHHQVRVGKRVEAFDVGLRLGNGTGHRHRRAQAVPLLQDRRDHRHRDLGPVLIVSRDEDDERRAALRVRNGRAAGDERECHAARRQQGRRAEAPPPTRGRRCRAAMSRRSPPHGPLLPRLSSVACLANPFADLNLAKTACPPQFR